MGMKPLEPPYGAIWDLIKQGRVIPFLGAGASLSGRLQAKWDEHLLTTLPTGTELGQHLALKATFPDWQPSHDLALVAQYYSVAVGRTALRLRLRQIFGQEYPYAPIHEFLADIPAPLLIITTNYDNLIERAFRAKGHPFDLVVYPTDNKDWGGSASYWKHGASEPEFHSPRKLLIDLDRTTVIYKMHGTVDQLDQNRDSFVIDEDDYVEFLIRLGAKTAIPAKFVEWFGKRHFLFLGYSLRDWNFRVILSKIEKDLQRSKSEQHQSWAIQLNPSPLEQELWGKHNISIYDMQIREFIDRLRLEQAKDTQ